MLDKYLELCYNEVRKLKSDNNRRLKMKIKRIVESPFRKYTVKKLPKDAIYRQHNIDDNEVFYSKSKNAYYEVIKD